MNKDKKLKISSTAYRVLLLLLHLNKGQCNVDYLNSIFSSDEYISRYFSKDVILKYISTLRTAGYNISKPCHSNNYSYELNKSPVLMSLTEEQLKILASIDCYAESLHQNKLIDNYSSFLNKMKKFLPDKDGSVLVRELKKQRESLDDNFFRHARHAKLIKKIENFCAENRRVSVKYKPSCDEEEQKIVLELKNIKYDPKEVYVSGYNPITGQIHSVKLGQIVDIKQLPAKTQYNHVLSPVVFKLKGQLAKIYRPYEHEKIEQQGENTATLTVTAYVDDYESLIRRLLKYGENCEILYPRYARDAMIKIINQSIKNYKQI